MRRINAAGLALLKSFEGCRLTAYTCPAGKLTVGFGSVGPHVKPGMTITQAEADALLVKDLDRFERGVASACGEATDNAFSAFVCFAFNVGLGNFLRSSVLRHHLDGDRISAAHAFGLWNKARVKGVLKALPGLTRRRAAEAELYLSGKP